MALTSADREEIAGLYGEGMSASDIADEWGISKHSVRRIASQAGIKRGIFLADDASPDGVIGNIPRASRGDEGSTPSEDSTHQSRTNSTPRGNAADEAGQSDMRGDGGSNPSSGPITRRCRNKHCIERFVPVNDHHWYCTPGCRAYADKNDCAWDIDDILREEGMLHPGAAPNEMAKRAFGQKNKLLRKVNQLTSFRDYLGYEVRSIADERGDQRYFEVPLLGWQSQPNSPREGVLICSDWQIGKLENGIGVDEMEKRTARIVDATASITQHFRRSGYPLDRLHIVFAGDMIEGCFIYGGQNVTGLDRTGNSHRLIRQIERAARYESEVAIALSAGIEEVVVHSVPGNHGRTNGKNDFADPEDNFDTMAAMWARDKAQNCGRIQWDIEEDWFVNFDVLGHPVTAIHGDQWRGPVWQLEKLLPQWVTADVFGRKPDLFITAHRHDYMQFRVNGITVAQNGTIDGGSKYYLKQFGKCSPPTQTLIVMSAEYGVESTYPIIFPK